MGCIPFNAYDKHKMNARYFLSAFNITEKPTCSDFEKLIVNNLNKIIAVVSGLVVPAVGALVANYDIVDFKKQIKIDKYLPNADLSKNKELRSFFDKQDSDFRMHVIIWALHDAFIRPKAGQMNRPKLEKAFKNGTLSVEQLNYIYFIKQFINPRKIDFGVKPYITESEIYSYVDRVIKGHRKQSGYESFKRVSWEITDFINNIDVSQYDKNKDKVKIQKSINKIKENKSALAIVGAAAYLLGK